MDNNRIDIRLRLNFRKFRSTFGNRVLDDARAAVNSQWLPLSIIAIGIYLRANQYLANRPLWLDEASLALNIVNRSWFQLTRSLDYGQGAPIGFLIGVKLFVRILGNSEYALRGIPFFSGLASLFFFYWVLRKIVDPLPTLFGLGLFSISNQVVFYSADLKQYSSDVILALLIMWLGLCWQGRKLARREVVLGSALGAMAIWFSHPAIFVLGGVAIALGWLGLKTNEWKSIAKLMIVFSIWFCSFAIFYIVSLVNLTDNSALLGYWAGAFMPFPPSSLLDLRWISDNYLALFSDPAGLAVPGLAAFAFLVGSISLFSRDRAKFLLLFSPLFLTLIASSLHQYPFSGRLLLFLVPSLVALVVEGVVRIARGLSEQTVFVSVLMGILFFVPPLLSNLPSQPIVWEEIKPVMSHVREHYQQGDIVYVYYGAASAFKYYQSQFGFTDHDYVVGVFARNDWSNYQKDLERFRGRRVWVVFSHIWVANGVDEEKLFSLFLDKMGTRFDSFKAPGAAVYLYDLR